MLTRKLLTAATALLLASCGGGEGGGGSSTPSKPAPAAVAVTVSPATITLAAGGSTQFQCAVTGSTNTACNWSVDGAGTINASGLYTAPMAAGTATVRATSAADASKSATASVTVTGYTPWVTAYYAGYNWPHSSPADVDMTALTHFVFARVAPGSGSLGGAAGQVVKGGGTAHDAGENGAPDSRPVEDYLIAKAHAANAKAVLMIGGVGDGGGFLRSTTNAMRPTFIKNLLDYLIAHDYDGLDLDWEDELGDLNSENLPAAETYRRLIALMTELRAEAAKRPRYQDPAKPFILTFPGYAINPNIDSVQPWQVQAATLADQYNLMTYGIGTTATEAGWSSWFQSPISGAKGDTPVDLTTSVNLYVAAGVPRRKLGIGIGFYGIYYVAPISEPNQPTNHWWELQADDSPLAYRYLLEDGYFDHGTLKWNDAAQVSYRTYGAAGYVPPSDPQRYPAGYLSYETQRSIARKGEWVRAEGLGGAIIWTVDYGYLPGNGPAGSGGSNPLLANVKCSFLLRGCPAPPTRGE